MSKCVQIYNIPYKAINTQVELRSYVELVCTSCTTMSGKARTSSGKRSKGNGKIKPTGKWGVYNTYAIDSTDLDADKYNINSVMWDAYDLSKALPTIRPQDVNKNGIVCEFLCVNPMGQVIGWNPFPRD